MFHCVQQSAWPPRQRVDGVSWAHCETHPARRCRPDPGRQGSASAEAWVTEVLDVTNALQAAGMLGKPSEGRLLH